MPGPIVIGDRITAIIYFFVVLAILIGGKSSGVALAVLVFFELFTWLFRRRDSESRNPIWTGVTLDAGAVWLFALSALILLSALWSKAPQDAVAIALQLAICVGAIRLLDQIYTQGPLQRQILCAGWLAIGFCLGLMFLIHESITRHAATTAVLNHFAPLLPNKQNGMSAVEAGEIVYFASEAAIKWSIGSMALLLWPAMAIVDAVVRGRWRRRISWIVYVLAILLVFRLTAHTTSQIALMVATLAFASANLWPNRVEPILKSIWVFVAAMAVPIAIFCGYLQLQDATWLSESGKSRIVMWQGFAESVLEAPIIGHGVGTIRAAAEIDVLSNSPTNIGKTKTAPKFGHAHNAYLQIWTELGAFGALIFLAAGLSMIGRIFKFPEKIVPYAVAAWMTGVIMIGSSWNIWYTWLQALLGMTCVVLIIAARLHAFKNEDGTVAETFSDIWLPKRVPRSSVS